VRWPLAYNQIRAMPRQAARGEIDDMAACVQWQVKELPASVRTTVLEVAGRARGRLEYWQKWSFPHGPASLHGRDSAGWRLVSKRRRISPLSLAGPASPVGGSDGSSGRYRSWYH
jgi:hypothetical protein